MVIIGIIVVLVALALGVALILGTSNLSGQKIEIDFFDPVVVTVTPLILVVGGMLTMLLLLIGLATVRSALARKQRLRKERKARDQQAKEQQVAHDQLVEQDRERERLAHEERERQYQQELEEQKRAAQAERERAEIAERQTGAQPVAGQPAEPTRPMAPGETGPAAGTGSSSAPPPRPSWSGDGSEQRATETQRIDPGEGRR